MYRLYITVNILWPIIYGSYFIVFYKEFEINSCSRINWLNKADHTFAVPARFANLTDEPTFGSHFGTENCLINAKEVTEFVYHTKKESAQGLKIMFNLLAFKNQKVSRL